MGDNRIETSLNLNVRGMTPSATVAINERSNELLAEGREIFKLGLGQSPFPVPDVVVDHLKTHAHEKDYLPVAGLRALRDAVAAYHDRRQHISRTGEDVLIAPGSKELMFLLQLVYYGELVIPRSSWVSYAPQAQIIGRRVHWLDTSPQNNWKLVASDLDELCADEPDRPRLVILNYPNNPSGYTYSETELRDLADVARARGILLLSDEIYGELHHDGAHKSIAPMYPEGTIVSAGLSKWCGAGGWRLGTFTFPPQLAWLRKAMTVVASETFTSTAAPIQYAAVRAFEGGEEIEEYLARSRRVLKALGPACAAKLRAAGAHLADPQGGFYLLPNFAPLQDQLFAAGIKTSAQLARRALEETGVAFLPGSDFGFAPDKLTARMAYVDFDGAAALGAVGDDPGEAFLRERCPRVMTAMDRIANWLAGF